MITEEELLQTIKDKLASAHTSEQLKDVLGYAMALAGLGNVYGMEQAIRLSIQLKIPRHEEMIANFTQKIVEAKRKTAETLEWFTEQLEASVATLHPQKDRISTEAINQLFKDANRSSIKIYKENGHELIDISEIRKNCNDDLGIFETNLLKKLKESKVPATVIYYLSQGISKSIDHFLRSALNNEALDKETLDMPPITVQFKNPKYGAVLKEDGTLVGIASHEVNQLLTITGGEVKVLSLPKTTSVTMESILKPDGDAKVVKVAVPDIEISGESVTVKNKIIGSSDLDFSSLKFITSQDAEISKLMRFMSNPSLTIGKHEESHTSTDSLDSPPSTRVTTPREGSRSISEDTSEDHPLMDEPEQPQLPRKKSPK